jgi:hypothetical protein
MEALNQNYRSALLELVDKFCNRSGKTRAYVAGKVVKDRRFFDNFAGGTGCTVETYLKLQNWLTANMPARSKNAKRSRRNAAAQHVSQVNS